MNITRHTSIESYNTLKANGILSGIQLRVFQVIFENGPLTQGEAWNEHLSEYQRHSIAPRFAELEKLGMIKVVGERPCRLTNVKGLLWDVTEHIPTEKQIKIPTKKLADVLPDILKVLSKVEFYLDTLPNDSKQEVLHYDVNQLLEKLK